MDACPGAQPVRCVHNPRSHDASPCHHALHTGRVLLASLAPARRRVVLAALGLAVAGALVVAGVLTARALDEVEPVSQDDRGPVLLRRRSAVTAEVGVELTRGATAAWLTACRAGTTVSA